MTATIAERPTAPTAFERCTGQGKTPTSITRPAKHRDGVLLASPYGICPDCEREVGVRNDTGALVLHDPNGPKKAKYRVPRSAVADRPSLPGINVKAALDAARREVKRHVDDQHGDPEATLLAVAKLIRDAEDGLDALKKDRDVLGAAAVFVNGARPSDVFPAMGVSRSWLSTVQRTYKGVADDLPKDALERLPKVAADVVARESTIEAAEPYRDDATRALRASGWSRDRLAVIIGRNPSRVSHLTAAIE